MGTTNKQQVGVTLGIQAGSILGKVRRMLALSLLVRICHKEQHRLKDNKPIIPLFNQETVTNIPILRRARAMMPQAGSYRKAC